jgi:peptide subunit release factor 1 (eRF1)
LDAYGGYGIALVDKQDARLYYFHLGELLAEEDLSGEEIRRTKRGGGSQAPGRRGGTAGQTNYVKEATERNIKDAAELAARFFADNNVRRVLIGGTEANATQFRSHLPKAWQSLVVGAFPISKTVSRGELMQRALEVGGKAERKQEALLVRKVVSTAAKGRGGVVDLEDTLNAVHDGRVQILVIREGYRAPGYRCQGCGYLTSEKLADCPFCGKGFDRIPDAAELAVRRVMREGGEVEVVRDSEGSKDFGSIGALLRY